MKSDFVKENYDSKYLNSFFMETSIFTFKYEDFIY